MNCEASVAALFGVSHRSQPSGVFGFAVADAAVGDDAPAEFDALAGRGGAFGFHSVNFRREARRVQGGGFFHSQAGCLCVETAGFRTMNGAHFGIAVASAPWSPEYRVRP
jgi:hypothetical protein